MGLILPQKVKIKWSTTAREHYKELGYTYTKVGDIFEVDVNDLTDGSVAKIKIKCDYCNNIIEKSWKDYRLIHSSTYCCSECRKHKRREYDESGDFVYVEIPYRNKEWLENEYVIKDREAQDIADECGINLRTMREWIYSFGLSNKRQQKRDNLLSSLSKEKLEILYCDKHLTSTEIGGLYNVSESMIMDLIKEYGIYVPSRSELINTYLYEKGGIEKARKTQSTMKNRIASSCRQHGISVEDFDGFSTTEQHMARNNTYYKEWIRNVFKRDNYTCKCCGRRGGNLNAHHLYNFSEYEYLRYDTENGITLCERCHLINYPNSFHSIYGERNNTPEQIQEFIKNYREEAV